MAIAQQMSNEMATIPRPIERLPVRKSSGGDQKEAMNCKSCRKRKVGYVRLDYLSECY